MEIGLHALPHAGMVHVTPRGKAVERYTSTKNYVLEVVGSPKASPASSSFGRYRDQKVSLWDAKLSTCTRDSEPTISVFHQNKLYLTGGHQSWIHRASPGTIRTAVSARF